MELPLFEPHVLSLLDALTVDPLATVDYEYLSGGLVWSDELPRDENGKRLVVRSGAVKYVLAYRASITLDQERSQFRPHWEQLERDAPNWPGLRPDRRDDAARRRLVARNEGLDRELDRLDRLVRRSCRLSHRSTGPDARSDRG